jgi:hypothetical protein
MSSAFHLGGPLFRRTSRRSAVYQRDEFAPPHGRLPAADGNSLAHCFHVRFVPESGY